MGRAKTKESHHKGPGRILKKRTESARPCIGYPDSAPTISSYRALVIADRLFADFYYLAIFARLITLGFCTLPNRKSASCLLPSTSVTVSFRQVPAQLALVFQS